MSQLLRFRLLVESKGRAKGRQGSRRIQCEFSLYVIISNHTIMSDPTGDIRVMGYSS